MLVHECAFGLTYTCASPRACSLAHLRFSYYSDWNTNTTFISIYIGRFLFSRLLGKTDDFGTESGRNQQNLLAFWSPYTGWVWIVLFALDDSSENILISWILIIPVLELHLPYFRRFNAMKIFLRGGWADWLNEFCQNPLNTIFLLNYIAPTL